MEKNTKMSSFAIHSLKWALKESIAQPMKVTIGIVKSQVRCSWKPLGYKVKRYATMTKVTLSIIDSAQWFKDTSSTLSYMNLFSCYVNGFKYDVI